MIPRLLEKPITKTLETIPKLVLVFGPRQAGKTTLLKSIKTQLEKERKKVLYLNCDLAEERHVINTTALASLKKLLAGNNVVLIDEAQRLDNSGLTLKIIHDNFPKIRAVATGSSSFRLKNKASDALTGRYIDFTLYPFSFSEMIRYQKLSKNPALRKQEADALLESMLLYGFYPDVYLESSPELKQRFIKNIIDSYLFADVLSFARIRHSQAIVDLARALAYQTGSEINENELAKRLKIDRKTVVNYLDVLEQSFVIIRVHPYSKNPRREIGRNYKVFFLDLGIRNGLIGDFNKLSLRSDIGALWENFIIVERLKLAANQAESLQYNFWRTYNGAEVDWIERRGSKAMEAFECKYRHAKLSRGAKMFSKYYKTPVQLITTETYLEYLL